MFLITEIKKQDGELVTVLTVPSKEFKTGSKGFYASSKAEIDGKKYQIQVQVVEIGSKQQSSKEEE